MLRNSGYSGDSVSGVRVLLRSPWLLLQTMCIRAQTAFALYICNKFQDLSSISNGLMGSGHSQTCLRSLSTRSAWSILQAYVDHWISNPLPFEFISWWPMLTFAGTTALTSISAPIELKLIAY